MAIDQFGENDVDDIILGKFGGGGRTEVGDIDTAIERISSDVTGLAALSDELKKAAGKFQVN